MALILILETATPVCSVALCKNGTPLASRQSHGHNDHAALLAVFIQDLFRETNEDLNSIDALAVSRGPGSYTGLRIGVSTAKGLCYSLDKPLLSLDTLQGMVAGVLLRHSASIPYPKQLLFCPMIDARRMEFYFAMYNSDLEKVSETEAHILDDQSFEKILSENRVVFFGSGSPKAIPVLGKNPHAILLEGFEPSSVDFAGLAEKQWKEKKFENVAYFEPYYLKDFIAGVPRVRGLQ